MSDLAFDPTLKKKKKKGKKKIGFDELEGSTATDEPVTQPAEEQKQTSDAAVSAEVKPKVEESAVPEKEQQASSTEGEADAKRIDADADSQQPESADAKADVPAPKKEGADDAGEEKEKVSSPKGSESNDVEDAEKAKDDADDAAEAKKKKKKSKKSKKSVEPLSKEARDAIVQLLMSGDIPWAKFKKNKSEDGGLGFDSMLKKKKKSKKPKVKSTGDEKTVFTYDDLLEQVFNIIKSNQPNAADDNTGFNLVPPNVQRFGAKKTGFTNFVQICQQLHRDREHVLSYLYAELGTSGSIDKADQLILKGKFQQKNIERVLRSYIKEYVRCHTCKSPNTILTKKNRLYFLQCEKCKSRCSVATIRTGYQMTGRRAVMRAKQAS